MGSPEKSQSHAKREVEDSSDGRKAVNGDSKEWEETGKRKQKLSKSKKSGNGEDIDGSGRRKSSGERSESLRVSGGSSRGDNGEGDYDMRKESRSKQVKKKPEITALENLSNWYQDGEIEKRHDGGDKSSNKNHARGDDDERNAARKTNSKFSDSEGSYRRSKSKEERAIVGEDEKAVDKDSYHSERRERSREKGHGISEDVKNRRRWDESNASEKTEDISCMKTSSERTHERNTSSRLDTGEGKDRVVESISDKGKSYSKEERRADSDRSKSKSRSDALEEDNKASPMTREDRTGREKSDKHREQNTSGHHDNQDRLCNPEEDGNPLMRDKTSREMEYESSNLKRKELEMDGRENSWSDRNRDREGFRDNWKRRQQASNDREWELPRRGLDRMDNERPLGRAGYRKDGRTEVVKTSSNFGISTENYDVIEIQLNPVDYGRDNPESSFSGRIEALPLDDEGARSQDDVARVESGKFVDEAVSVEDQNSWRDDLNGKEPRPRGPQGSFQDSGAQISSFSSQPPHSNQEPSVFGRVVQPGVKGNRLDRVGRVRPPHSNPMPLMGSPFGHLGMPPPGPMQPMNPGMSAAGGPPVPPGVFVSPFSPPVVWHGGRGPAGQQFPPNMGPPPNPALFFNQPGQGRGLPPNASGAGFNAIVPIGRGNSNDTNLNVWVPRKNGGPAGKAPSRGEQNDYSQNFVDTGMRPQNFIRELELTNVEDYPKLRELLQKKDEIVVKAATPPMYYKCDLRELTLSPEFFGTKFDVILVDPPWEEYVHRAPGVADHMEYWTFEEIMNLKIEAIADTPSFIFLWVGDGVGLEQGRQCLKKWGFRRCEDICWVKTNKHTATQALRHDSHTLFQHSKEHCLMGIKGTVRRSTDGHVIHANIDTDVIVADELPYGSTTKPEEMYRIIEHFALGRRRIELFGGDHNIRTGWLTVGKGLSSSNFNAEAYIKSFADKDGKVWQGGGGRIPPTGAPHLVQTTPDIEALRPKSPMKNQQQQQQQQQQQHSNSISLTTPDSNPSIRRPVGNSPQNPTGFNLNPETWASPSPMDGLRGPNDNVLDMYGYNMHSVQPHSEYTDFESQRMMNNML